MPLLAHLTEADLRRYVAGARSLQTERHARVCIWCMHRLADAAHEIDELLAQIEEDRRRHAA
jgi:hypothetical protein